MRLLVDHLKQNRAYVFPEKVLSTRVIFDSSRFAERPKAPSTAFAFNLPVTFAGVETDKDPQFVNNRYVVERELVQSTFADLLIVRLRVQGPQNENRSGRQAGEERQEGHRPVPAGDLRAEPDGSQGQERRPELPGLAGPLLLQRELTRTNCTSSRRSSARICSRQS